MARNWLQTLCVGLACAAALCSAGVAQALTLGPALDFYQVVSATDPSPLHATAWTPPLPGAQQPALRGQVRIVLQPDAAPLPVVGIGYLGSDSGTFSSGTLLFTSVFGTNDCLRRIDPCREDDPIEPKATSGGFEEGAAPHLGPYVVIGESGAAYRSRPALRVTLADLPSVLGSGFDLSPFVGSPSGVFFVFQTELPASELLTAVPEPGSALLLAGGLVVLVLARRSWRLRADGQPLAQA